VRTGSRADALEVDVASAHEEQGSRPVHEDNVYQIDRVDRYRCHPDRTSFRIVRQATTPPTVKSTAQTTIAIRKPAVNAEGIA
jgi:hypothetical protein